MTMFKTSLLALFVLSGLLICQNASAQYGVPASLQGDFNRMQAQNSMNFANQMSMQRMMNQHWYFGNDFLINPKYDFTITMKDKSVLQAKSKIYADTASHKSYLVFTDKALKRSDPNRERKIYADQTLNVTREEPNPSGTTHTVVGIPTDSCWLFKVETGKINMYSHLSEQGDLNNFYLRAIQIGDGPILKPDSATLVNTIKDNPKAMKAFKKKDYYKAITKFNDKKSEE